MVLPIPGAVSRSLAGPLRREERREDVRQDIDRDAVAGVLDQQGHILAFDRPGVATHEGPVERGIRGRDADGAAVCHGIARVHHQVHQDLRDLPRISAGVL